MPDINFGEWIIIGLIALVVVGPRSLPDLARKVGGFMRDARSMAREFRLSLEQEISELDEVKKEIKEMGGEISKPLKEMSAEIESASKDMSSELDAASKELKPLDWTGPVSKNGPTPDDSAEDFKRIHATEQVGENLVGDGANGDGDGDGANGDSADVDGADGDGADGEQDSAAGQAVNDNAGRETETEA